MSSSDAWLCTVCGYVHQGDAPPDVCPVCGAMASDFEPYEPPAPAARETPPRQWRCLNCGYVHDGPEPPDVCPVCAAGPDRFEAVPTAAVETSADSERHLVIAGGGIAGVAAAETARQTAPHCRITLLTEEPRLPYYRLNLTRVLAGEIALDSLPIHPEAWYAEHAVTLKTGVTVRELAPVEHGVRLADGTEIAYDRLILANGSHAFVPPIPGADQAGVMTLRTAADADAILSAIASDARCIVIGGGILGIETAGALAGRADVTLIESHDWLMPRQLTPRAAAVLERYLAGLGVQLEKQARTAEILGDGQASGIRLESGAVIEAPLVILATGVRPNTHLARKAGLEVDRGIVVDNCLRTTRSDIFAAGDVAEHNGVCYGAWGPSQFQGSIAALNALDVPTEFGGVPRSNALKVLGVDVLSIGRFTPEDGSYLVLEQEQADRFAHFVFHDGKMAGAILLGYPGLGTAVKQAVEQPRDFSALLADTPSAQEVIGAL